jgi:hypothetical protein
MLPCNQSDTHSSFCFNPVNHLNIIYSDFKTTCHTMLYMSLTDSLSTIQLQLLMTETQFHQHHVSHYLVVFHSNYLNPFNFFKQQISTFIQTLLISNSSYLYSFYLNLSPLVIQLFNFNSSIFKSLLSQLYH